jgi:hypothetical protein
MTPVNSRFLRRSSAIQYQTNIIAQVATENSAGAAPMVIAMAIVSPAQAATRSVVRVFPFPTAPSPPWRFRLASRVEPAAAISVYVRACLSV